MALDRGNSLPIVRAGYLDGTGDPEVEAVAAVVGN